MCENPTIRVPRWVQLVVLPVILLLAWALGHAIFLFLTASVIAFLLNPLVREFQGVRIRRGIGVAVVYLTFAAAVIVLIVALGTVVVEQTRSASDGGWMPTLRTSPDAAATARSTAMSPTSRTGCAATGSISSSATRSIRGWPTSTCRTSPWLSAVPALMYAVIVDPISVLRVAALFIFIYQVESWADGGDCPI